MSLDLLFGLLGGIIVLAFMANRLFRYTRIPDLIVLMGIGILLGPVLHWVDAARFKPVTHAFGTLALIVILFEGGLELKLRETVRHFPGALLLSLLSYTVTTALVALVVQESLHLSQLSSLLIGAVVGCTSSSMVLPILQQLRVAEATKVTLLLDASLGDVLAVLTVESLLNLSSGGTQNLLPRMLHEFGVPVILALLVGALWSRLLPLPSEQRFWQVLTFGVVLLLYGVSEALHGSGLIAVLAFGLTLANFPARFRPPIENLEALTVPPGKEHLPVLTFHSELAFLLRTFFFVLLGVVVEFLPPRYLLPAAGILGAILAGRWLAARVTRWSRSQAPEHERSLIVWILPRGLITAVLAIQVVNARGDDFHFLPAVAFAIILVTNALVILGSIQARKHAPAEPVAQPAPQPGT
jgi:cell volume regulation protein A